MYTTITKNWGRMSTYYGPSPLPPEAKPSKPKGAWWKKPIVWLPVAALLLGGAIGASGQPDPVEVVKEVPGPERVVTKTVDKPVEVTPEACLKALDLSEQGFSYSAEAMGYMSDALTAASKFDVAAMQKANADLEGVSPKMKELTTPMRSAATECRAAAK
jgi:hypothetical protein